MKLFHFKYEDLDELLAKKSKDHNSNVYNSIKEHINECNSCWNLWNRVRWDRAMKAEGFSDLPDYFGDQYVPYFDSSWALANQWYSQNPKNEDEISNFYKTTPYYIYNSFIFNKSGDRISKINTLTNIFKEYNIQSVLDYGCGIGLDGEEMLDLGMTVHFADFLSPSIDFLKWRLKRHNKEENAFVHNVEEIELDRPEVDLIWSIDVLEHMSDPKKILKVITPKTKAFIFFIDSAELNGGRHPFHQNVDYKSIENELIKLGFEKKKHDLFQIWIKKNQ